LQTSQIFLFFQPILVLAGNQNLDSTMSLIFPCQLPNVILLVGQTVCSCAIERIWPRAGKTNLWRMRQIWRIGWFEVAHCIPVVVIKWDSKPFQYFYQFFVMYKCLLRCLLSSWNKL